MFLCLWLGNKAGNAGAERCLPCSSPAVMTGFAWPALSLWLAFSSLLSVHSSGLFQACSTGFVAAGRFGLKEKSFFFLPPSEKWCKWTLSCGAFLLLFPCKVLFFFFFSNFILRNPCCLCHCQLAVLLYSLFLNCSIPYYFSLPGILSFLLPTRRYFLL